MRSHPRTTPVAALVAVVAASLAACSSSGGSTTSTGSAPSSSTPPSSPATTDVTVTVTHHPSSSASQPPSSNPPSSSPASPAGACGNKALEISTSEGNGASGHNRYVLYFHNVSSSTCTLHGYPGVDGLAASGSPLVHATRTLFGFTGGSRRGIPTVSVQPGKYASAIVEWETVQEGTGNGCDIQSAKIAVTAANTTRSVVFDRSVTGCKLQVHPTVPGKTGSLM